jgi:hypothetical protein
MIRSVWLAFAFLVFIAVLAAFRVGIATPSKQQVAIANDVAEPEPVQDVLAKADKLDDVPDRIPVQPIAIVPPQATPKAQEKPTKIVGRHWSDSYAKVKKRKYHRHHASHNQRASHKKYRRGRR